MQIDNEIAKSVLEKNNYKFLKVLGKGTNSTFYHCKNPKGEDVAVKFQIGSGQDTKAEKYLNDQRKHNYILGDTLSFEQAHKEKNTGTKLFKNFFDEDRYYIYLNLPKALEKNILKDIEKEYEKKQRAEGKQVEELRTLSIEKDEKVYISEALLMTDTVLNYLNKKLQKWWIKDFKEKNKGNTKLLSKLDKITKNNPNILVEDLEKELTNFADKDSLAYNKVISKQEQEKEKKAIIVKKAIKTLYPVLTNSIKGLSILHKKGLAHCDTHLGNFYYKKIDGKMKVQLADFDRIKSKKDLQAGEDLEKDYMKYDIISIFQYCVDHIVKRVYKLQLSNMPKSFQSLYNNVQQGKYTNAKRLLDDTTYKEATQELKKIIKEYEMQKNKLV